MTQQIAVKRPGRRKTIATRPEMIDAIMQHASSAVDNVGAYRAELERLTDGDLTAQYIYWSTRNGEDSNA